MTGQDEALAAIRERARAEENAETLHNWVQAVEDRTVLLHRLDAQAERIAALERERGTLRVDWDRLNTQDSEIAALRAERDTWQASCEAARNKALQNRLERDTLRTERDAARETLTSDEGSVLAKLAMARWDLWQSAEREAAALRAERDMLQAKYDFASKASDSRYRMVQTQARDLTRLSREIAALRAERDTAWKQRMEEHEESLTEAEKGDALRARVETLDVALRTGVEVVRLVAYGDGGPEVRRALCDEWLLTARATPGSPGDAPGADEREQGETCERCGRRYPTVWLAPNDVWRRVTGHGSEGLWCLPCFDAKARELGLPLYWECSLNGWHEQVVADLTAALNRLLVAEQEYCTAHDAMGDGSLTAGRAWVEMRCAGDDARKLLGVPDAVLGSPGDAGTAALQGAADTARAMSAVEYNALAAEPGVDYARGWNDARAGKADALLAQGLPPDYARGWNDALDETVPWLDSGDAADDIEQIGELRARHPRPPEPEQRAEATCEWRRDDNTEIGAVWVSACGWVEDEYPDVVQVKKFCCRCGKRIVVAEGGT